MAKKKNPDQGKKRANPEGVMGLKAQVLEQPITDTLEPVSYTHLTLPTIS